jgi:maleylpyruvate isomerase
MQIYYKLLPVEIVPPPGGLGSAEIRLKNPIGKIPVLDLGEQSLGESWAIMEFLESIFPTPAMLPSDPYARASLQALVRFTDLYLAPAMFPLFRALRAPMDADSIRSNLSALLMQLNTLEILLARKATSIDCPFDLADAALLPVLWYAQLLAKHFGSPDCIAGLPNTLRWWQLTTATPAAARVLAEMEDGLRLSIPVLFDIKTTALA